MNFSDIGYFLSVYGAEKILCASVSLAVSLLIKKFIFKGKLKRLGYYLPFACGALISLALSAFSNEGAEVAEIVKSGAEIGSAATVIYVFFGGLSATEYQDVAIDSLVLEGMLAGHILPEDLPDAAEQIAKLLRSGESADALLPQLENKIKQLAPSITDEEATLIAKTAANVFVARK